MVINNVTTFLVSLCTGVIGITIGVIITYTLSNRSKRFEGALFGFTAGLMLSIVSFEMLPKAFELGSLNIGLVGIGLGIIFVIIIEHFIDNSIYLNVNYNNIYINSAILLSIAFSVHNIPEGIAIGSLLTYSISDGLWFALAITIHNIPEGIIIALPLKKSKVSIFYVILISLIISIFMGLGGVLGFSISHISKIFIALSLSFSGGIMLYVTAGEIIVKSIGNWKGRSITLSILFGIVVGILLSYH